jgi:hypothetical protein
MCLQGIDVGGSSTYCSGSFSDRAHVLVPLVASYFARENSLDLTPIKDDSMSYFWKTECDLRRSPGCVWCGFIGMNLRYFPYAGIRFGKMLQS